MKITDSHIYFTLFFLIGACHCESQSSGELSVVHGDDKSLLSRIALISSQLRVALCCDDFMVVFDVIWCCGGDGSNMFIECMSNVMLISGGGHLSQVTCTRSHVVMHSSQIIWNWSQIMFLGHTSHVTGHIV